MKKVGLFLFAIMLSSVVVFGQEYIWGLAPEGGNRGVTANGLTQLYSVTGKYTISADGTGSLSSAYVVDVLKPNAGATVHKAILLGAPVWGSSNACTQLNGNPITWDGSSSSAWGCCNYHADVTSIVAPIVNAAAPGITSIPVIDCGGMDGHALLVVFADPLAQQKTIVVMFGGLSTTGDNFSLSLAEAIDPSDPDALFDMGLGISYSAYGPSGGQRSIVDVNGQRLTSSANGEDDGSLANGALITVGGIGDVNTNPPDPFGSSSSDIRYDDELYSLLPLITNSTTDILVNTLNPSNDDNIFLAYFAISGAAIIGEGILLTQEADTNFVGTDHTVTAHLQDDEGDPLSGITVTFTVISGPNQGETGNAVTNAEGHAYFTYTGNGGVGIDEIEACLINSQQQEECSNILEKVWITGEDVPLSNWAIFIGIALIIGFAIFRFRR